jgi:hypothetical protein
MQMAKSSDWSRCEVWPGRIPLRRHGRTLTTELRCFWCERNDHQKRRRILRLSLGFTVSAKCVNHFINNSLLIKRRSIPMQRQWLGVPLLWGLHRTLLICTTKQKLLIHNRWQHWYNSQLWVSFLESTVFVRFISVGLFILIKDANKWVNLTTRSERTVSPTDSCTTDMCQTYCCDWKIWSANSPSTCGWILPMLTITQMFWHRKIIFFTNVSFQCNPWKGVHQKLR